MAYEQQEFHQLILYIVGQSSKPKKDDKLSILATKKKYKDKY